MSQYSWLRKAYPIIVWIFVITLSLITVATIGLSIRLSQGPISLDFFDRYIKKKLYQFDQNLKVRSGGAFLNCDTESKSLVIQIKELHIHGPDTQDPVISIHQSKLSFNIWSFFIGRTSPALIEIKNLQLNFTHREEQKFFTARNGRKDRILEWLKSQENQKLFTNIPQLRIINAKVELEDEILLGQRSILIPEISLIASHKGMRGIITMDLNTMGKIQANLIPQERGAHAFDIQVTDVKSAQFFKSPRFIKIAQHHKVISDFSTYLQGINFPLSIHIKGQFNDAWVIKKTEISLTGEKGSLTLPESKPVKLNKIDIRASIQNSILEIQKLEIFSAHTKAKLRGKAQINYNNDGVASVDFNINGEALNVMIDELSNLWPKALAPTPYQWITTNITKGQVPKATIVLKGKLFLTDSPKNNFLIEELNGDIDIKRASVKYINGLPAVDNIHARASYNIKTFEYQNLSW